MKWLCVVTAIDEETGEIINHKKINKHEWTRTGKEITYEIRNEKYWNEQRVKKILFTYRRTGQTVLGL